MNEPPRILREDHSPPQICTLPPGLNVANVNTVWEAAVFSAAAYFAPDYEFSVLSAKTDRHYTEVADYPNYSRVGKAGLQIP